MAGLAGSRTVGLQHEVSPELGQSGDSRDIPGCGDTPGQRLYLNIRMPLCHYSLCHFTTGNWLTTTLVLTLH